MRILTRLRIISTVASVALLALVPVLIWTLSEFRQAKNDYALANTIRLNFFERASLRDQYFLYREERLHVQWDKNKQVADGLLSQASRQFRNTTDQQVLERLRRNIGDTVNIFHRIVNNTEAMRSTADNHLVYEEFDKRLYSQLLLKAAAVRDTTTVLQDASAQRVEQSYQRLTLLFGGFAATLALTIIFTSAQIGRLYHRRLIPLHKGAEIIANGDLDHRIQVQGADEFTDLALSVNAMTDKLQVFTKRLEAEISAHKLAEEHLGELNRDFVSFLENTSDFVYFKDRDSRFRFCSQTLANITGHASWRDMIGKHDLEVFPADTAQIYYEEEWPIFRDGKPLLNKVDPYYDVAGHAGWVSTNKWPLLDSAGTVAGLFGISRDVTESKLAEQALQTESAKNLALVRNASDGVHIVDLEGSLLEFSDSFCAMLGYGREEMIGMNVARWDAAMPVDEIFQGIRQQYEQQTRTQFETRHRRKDGVVLDVEVSGFPLGQAKAMFYASRDITARKQAEEKLRLAASVFTHAREGIMITAADGTILDVNDTFSRITGYSREETLGNNPRLLSSGRHEKEFYADLWRNLIEHGYWNGEIWNRRKNGEVFAEMLTISAARDNLGSTRQYVALFSDISLLKEHEHKLEKIAHFDALTALPNRVLLADRLHQAMVQAQRRQQRLAVAYLDLDGFKTVNDNFGHSLGDQLLIAVASHMKLALREGDTLARLGGDEFIAVLLDLTDIQDSVPMLSRLLAAAAQPVQIGGQLLQVSASVGVTFYPQAEEVDADQLLRQADQAMYQAKLAGKNRYHVFDAEQDRNLRGHHESLEHLRRALTAREFVLHYQPKVNLRSGALIGAEALIRWQHPDRGLLPPAAFLPAIEDHPLAVELGEWVIDSALTQKEIWQAAGLDIPVSVNIGARQLQQTDFVQRLHGILAAHPLLGPGDLELEVLETSALDDLAWASQVIEACGEIGVMFALDDFGTGYSSLTYLKRLPVTQLKIDQSFVRDMLDDPDDLAILEGVLGLAAAFRRQAIAEGVETVAHGEMLLRLGCELAQGYGIAHPMPGHELPGWAARWRPDPAWVETTAVSRDDLPLLFAGVEHRAWIAAITNHLQGGEEGPPPLDLHRCRFGTWLYGEGLDHYADQVAFQAIEPLHRQVHTLAAALCALDAGSQNSQALARLTELHSLRDALLAQLNVLAMEITRSRR